MGQYNQIMREPGEVFDLLTFPDGTYPHKTREVEKKGPDGKGTGVFELKVIKMKDGKPAHRDFAADQGVRLVKSGPMKGEVVQLGWMRRVDEKIPVGMYPPGTDFWSPNLQLPQAWPRSIGQQDKRATQIAAHLDPTPAAEIEELEDL
jgi:hypothetical protein